MVTYDSVARRGRDPAFPAGLDRARGYYPIALYLAWIAERDLASEDFAETYSALAAELQNVRAGDQGFAQFAAALREVAGDELTSEHLNADGEAFTSRYYEIGFDEDWRAAIVYESKGSPFEVEPTAEHLDDLYEQLDDQFECWEAGEWDDEDDADLFEGTVRLWDLDAGAQILGQNGEHATYSPDQLRVATADLAGRIEIHSALTGERVAELEGHTAMVTCLAWSPDGRKLASASLDGTVRIWDAASYAELVVFEGGEEVVESLVFNALGNRLLTTGQPMAAYEDDDEHDDETCEDEHCELCDDDGRDTPI